MDSETVEDGSEAIAQILGFERLDDIEIVSTSEGAARRLTFNGVHSGPEWISTEVHCGDGSWQVGGVELNDRMRADLAQEPALHADLDTSEVVGGLIWLSYAQDGHADAFVTRNRYIIERANPSATGEANVTSVEDALALIGLFLRIRNRDEVSIAPRMTMNSNPISSQRTVVRNLMPASYAWTSACGSRWQHAQDRNPLDLTHAAIIRMDQVLRARDAIHDRARWAVDNESLAQLRYQTEIFLVMLVSSFDAVARVLHAVYQLPGDQRFAGWRRKEWLENLRSSAPTVASIMLAKRRARVIFDCLAELRNLIHAETLGVTSLNTASVRYPRIVIEDPGGKTREACAEWTLGTRGGLEEHNGTVLVDVPRLVETVLPLLIQTMNVIMERTDIARLPDVDPADIGGPPAPDPELAYVHRAVHRLAGL